MRFALLFRLGKGEESINHTGLVANLVQIGLIDEVHQQALFCAVAQATANHSPHFIYKFRLALNLLVVLKDQLKDVIQIDFLRFEQVHLKDHIIPVNGGFVLIGGGLFPAQPVAHIVVGGTVILNFPLGRERDGLKCSQIVIIQIVFGLECLYRCRFGHVDALQFLQTGELIIVLQHVLYAQILTKQLGKSFFVGFLLNGGGVGEACFQLLHHLHKAAPRFTGGRIRKAFHVLLVALL